MKAQLKTTSIPVTPLVRKVLAKQYSIEPFVINYKANIYAAFLLACLDRFPAKEIPKGYNRLTETLTVGIAEWQALYGFGSCLAPSKILAFNDFVRNTFYDKMVFEVGIRIKHKRERVLDAVQSFLKENEITEEEFSLDTAIRYYHRRTKPCPQGRPPMPATSSTSLLTAA